MRKVICPMVLLLALLAPLPSLAVNMFVSPGGDGSFIIEGEDAQGMQTIDIAIGYDTATLAHPRLEAQGATVADVSADTPGMLTARISRENTDSGFELYLKFDKSGELPGGINYVTATAVDNKGRNYDASSDLRALTPPPPATPATEPAATAGGGTDASRDGGMQQEPAGAPGDGANAAPVAAKPEKPAVEGEMTGDGDKSGVGTAQAAPRNGTPLLTEQQKSVLERFREYKGKTGLGELATMFERREWAGMVQEPPVALSDGKTPVIIRLEREPEEGTPPHIALTGAKLFSLRKVGDKEWIVTAVPVKGTWKACLTVREKGGTIEFPLAIAPPVEIPKGTTEKNFTSVLDMYVSARPACREGEGEQCRRYFHEYVFTANYLAKGKKEHSKETGGLK